MAELKLVSYNLHNSTQKENLVKNIVDLSQSGVNVFCLQEVRGSESGRFIGDSVLQVLGSKWKAEFFLAKNQPYDYGLGFIWNTNVIQAAKFENISFVKLDFLSLFEQLIQYSQGGQMKPIQRGSLIGTFNIEGKSIRVSNVHLDWQGGKAHRIKQLEQLVRHLKTLPEVDSEIVCGDFNTVSFIGTDSHIKEVHSVLGKDFINSFPKSQTTARLGQHLDHIFARNLKLQEARIHEAVGSDHYPVVATLNF